VAFADAADIPPWALKAAEWAEQAGIIEGKPVAGGGVAFDAGGIVDRAQLATILWRYDRQANGTPSVPPPTPPVVTPTPPSPSASARQDIIDAVGPVGTTHKVVKNLVLTDANPHAEGVEFETLRVETAQGSITDFVCRGVANDNGYAVTAPGAFSTAGKYTLTASSGLFGRRGDRTGGGGSIAVPPYITQVFDHVEVRDWIDGLRGASGSKFVWCYSHDVYAPTTQHADAAQIEGQSDILFEDTILEAGAWLASDGLGNSALQCSQRLGDVSNIVIRRVWASAGNHVFNFGIKKSSSGVYANMLLEDVTFEGVPGTIGRRAKRLPLRIADRSAFTVVRCFDDFTGLPVH